MASQKGKKERKKERIENPYWKTEINVKKN